VTERRGNRDLTEHVVEHWGRPEPDSLERQYEFAEDHGVAQLHKWMRGEAVRQLQEILGIETDPEMWYFVARNDGPADQYHIILDRAASMPDWPHAVTDLSCSPRILRSEVRPRMKRRFFRFQLGSRSTRCCELP
jgi:hypothetical protein